MRTQSRRRPPDALLATTAAGTLLTPLLSGCWAGAGGLGGSDAINVLMVNNPQMVELQKLTSRYFTRETGIKVNFTVLPGSPRGSPPRTNSSRACRWEP